MPFPNEDTQFKPGQSGNPAGKKPGTRHYSTLLRLALEAGVEVEINRKKITVDETELIKQVAKGIAKGNIKFIELAFDRVDGKAAQPIEHSGEIKTTADLSKLSTEEIRKRLAELEDGADEESAPA